MKHLLTAYLEPPTESVSDIVPYPDQVQSILIVPPPTAIVGIIGTVQVPPLYEAPGT